MTSRLIVALHRAVPSERFPVTFMTKPTGTVLTVRVASNEVSSVMSKVSTVVSLGKIDAQVIV